LDNELRVALCNAAKRGVDVRIITPGIPDKKIVFRLTRANYRPLLAVGVKIYEYTPGFIHAKSMVSDDTTGVVGSINLDYRSLYLHFECSTYFYGCPAVAQLKGDVEQTLTVSTRVFWEQLRPGFWGSALDACLRTFETLF
jgi:cardiolipin synthase